MFVATSASRSTLITGMAALADERSHDTEAVTRRTLMSPALSLRSRSTAAPTVP